MSTGASDRVVWKSGLHPGFNANIAYSPVKRRGSVVLSNSNHMGIKNLILGPADSIDIGFRLVDPRLFPAFRLNKLL